VKWGKRGWWLFYKRVTHLSLELKNGGRKIDRIEEARELFRILEERKKRDSVAEVAKREFLILERLAND